MEKAPGTPGCEHDSKNGLDVHGRPMLRFKVGDKVLANIGSYSPGTVIAIWDSNNPYRIKLDTGTEVWGPKDTNLYARCAFFGRSLHSRMQLDPTHVRLKLLQACDQWHSSRVFTPLTG
jgi:hypothetical protein